MVFYCISESRFVHHNVHHSGTTVLKLNFTFSSGVQVELVNLLDLQLLQRTSDRNGNEPDSDSDSDGENGERDAWETEDVDKRDKEEDENKGATKDELKGKYLFVMQTVLLL